MCACDHCNDSPSFDALIAGSGLPRIEARALLEHSSGKSREWLVAHGDEQAQSALVERFRNLCQRRLGGEPLAYLVGEREFHGRKFKVDNSVLIPRPETETLVELAAAAAPPGARILELGTGSGCIAITLNCLRSDLTILATDISPPALALAQGNAMRHCPQALQAAHLRFRQGSWWSALKAGECFELILANPPYVAAADPHLAQGDLRFEPAGALACGDDGLDAIRTICAGAPAHLGTAGTLLLEHGYDQGQEVRGLFRAAGFEQIATVRDPAGLERVTTGRMPGSRQ